MAGVKIVAVPYKGGAPALTAVMAGDIPISINPLAEVVGQLDGGQLRAVAVTSAQRSKALPEIATVAESGVPGYDYNSWYGFLAPAKMPKDLLDKLNGEIVRALHEPDVEKKLTDAGVLVVGNTPQQFGEFIKAEMAKAQKIIETAHIKAD